jgi:2-polyprenyl-6-methoxyphenol hydroxylase-like FAD-dependent oxidoreductase
MRSQVARTVGAPEYDARPALTCAYYTYWSGVPIQSFEIYPRDRWIVMAFPTNDGLVCTFCEWPREEFHSVRADIEGHFMKKLELAPGLAQRLREGKREANFVGTGVLPNFFRKPYGSGWALVGDAGHHKDPVGGLGIMDAFRDAELLADALDAVLSGRRPLDEALGGYEQLRNAAAMQEYERNYQLARLQPPGREAAAVRGSARQLRRDGPLLWHHRAHAPKPRVLLVGERPANHRRSLACQCTRLGSGRSGWAAARDNARRLKEALRHAVHLP